MIFNLWVPCLGPPFCIASPLPILCPLGRTEQNQSKNRLLRIGSFSAWETRIGGRRDQSAANATRSTQRSNSMNTTRECIISPVNRTQLQDQSWAFSKNVKYGPMANLRTKNIWKFYTLGFKLNAEKLRGFVSAPLASCSDFPRIGTAPMIA